MGVIKEVKVAILGDADSMVRAFHRADKAASGFGRGGSALMAAGMGAVAGGAAVAAQAIGEGLVTALKTGVSEMQEQEKVSAQTSAVLKSTGNAAGVTKDHIEGLASALQAQTGTQDDAIQSSENLLLTFTNISNKGPDKMFDRATKAALDLSVAFHKDLNSSSVMVGKALNDPVKGVTALQRVGVSFTQSQKATIKSLAETGQTAKAQKLILHELETQVGGSAKAFGETTPGQIAKAKRAFEDLSQGAVQAIAPIGAAILPSLVTALRGTVTWFQTNWPRIREVAMQVYQWFQINLLPSFKEIGRGIGSIVVSIVGIFRQYWPQIIAVVRPVFDNIRNIVMTGMAVIKGVVNLISSLLKGDFSGAWRALGGIVSAVVTGIVTGLLNIAKQLVATAALVAKAAFDLGVKIAGAIVRGIASAPANIVRVVAGWFGADSVGTGAQPFAVKNGKVVGMAVGAGIAQGIMTGTAKVQNGIGNSTDQASSNAKGPAGTKARPVGQAISDGIAQGVRDGGPNLNNVIGQTVMQGIQAGKDKLQVRSPSRVAARDLGAPLAQGVAQGIRENANAPSSALSAAMATAIRAARGQLQSLGSTLGGMVNQRLSSTYVDPVTGKTPAQMRKEQRAQLDERRTIELRAARDSFEEGSDDRKRAQQELDDWLNDQAISAAEQAATDAGNAGETAVNNWIAKFNNGEIDLPTLQANLDAAVGGPMGEQMGAAFAAAFNKALTDVIAQANNIAGAVGSGEALGLPSGADTSIADAAAQEQARQSAAWPKAAKQESIRISHLPRAQRAAAWASWIAAHGENSDQARGFATGGIVTGPMHALIGEAGPEAVIPLASPRAKEMLSGAGSRSTGISLTFNGVLNAKDAARMLRPELDRLVRIGV
jgi:hypothetical protein